MVCQQICAPQPVLADAALLDATSKDLSVLPQQFEELMHLSSIASLQHVQGQNAHLQQQGSNFLYIQMIQMHSTGFKHTSPGNNFNPANKLSTVVYHSMYNPYNQSTMMF
jgi:hypothetical protein